MLAWFTSHLLLLRYLVCSFKSYDWLSLKMRIKNALLVKMGRDCTVKWIGLTIKSSLYQDMV